MTQVRSDVAVACLPTEKPATQVVAGVQVRMLTWSWKKPAGQGVHWRSLVSEDSRLTKVPAGQGCHVLQMVLWVLLQGWVAKLPSPHRAHCLHDLVALSSKYPAMHSETQLLLPGSRWVEAEHVVQPLGPAPSQLTQDASQTRHCPEAVSNYKNGKGKG